MALPASRNDASLRLERRRPTGGAYEVVVVVLGFALYHLVYFLPALVQDRLLAPGDGLIYYVPALLSPARLWNHALYAGHPSFADPQALYFSALRLLGNYNAAVVANYVLASVGAYCLTRYLTGMRVAGVFAGVVYGSGAAMIAHLGHLTIIYSAAWIPLIAWAVARVRDGDFPSAVAIGAVGIGLSMLGGHPQLFVYGLLLTSLYALYSLLDPQVPNRGHLLLRYVVMFGAGVAIAGLQLAPVAELGAWSLRSEMTFTDFTSYALDPRSLLLFFFPRMLGSYSGFDVPYFGSWNITELATYAGIPTLLLALIAVSARAREREVVFWSAAAIVAVLYALGSWTPLSVMAFHVPVLNGFRAAGRAAFVTTLSLAVLAGFGLRAINQRRLTGARLRRVRSRAAMLLGVPIVGLAWAYASLPALAHRKGIVLPSLVHNRAVIVAWVAMAVSALVVYWTIRRPSTSANVTLLIIVVLDLGSFGWFQEWRGGPPADAIALDGGWRDFARVVRDAHERILFLDGAKAREAPTRPNLNLLYGLPSAGGYGPLMLRTYAEVMGLDPDGSVTSIDGLKARLQLSGVGWFIGGAAGNRDFRFGGDCSDRAGLTQSTIELPRIVNVTRVEIVSQMFCSVSVAQDTAVMKMDLVSPDGPGTDIALRAGVDTAEWAIDRRDVAATVRHGLPSESETYDAGGFNGRWFHARRQLRLDGLPVAVARVTLQWMQPPAPGIAIRSIDLIDAMGAHHTISGEDLLLGRTGGESSSLPGAKRMFREKGILGQAWLVGETLPATDAAALVAIRTGHLADGRPFDPYHTALTDVAGPQGDSDRLDGNGHAVAPGRVVIDRESDGSLSLETDTPGDRFLVVAESFYPGWKVFIDGKRVAIVRTNVAFQGVQIPAGKHHVLFSFASTSLRIGIALASAGIALLALYLLFAWRARRCEMHMLRAAQTPPIA